MLVWVVAYFEPFSFFACGYTCHILVITGRATALITCYTQLYNCPIREFMLIAFLKVLSNAFICNFLLDFQVAIKCEDASPPPRIRAYISFRNKGLNSIANIRKCTDNCLNFFSDFAGKKKISAITLAFSLRFHRISVFLL